VGRSALNANVAANNTALGAFALTANSTGTYLTALGNESLKANTTGNSNVGIGAWSLLANTTGAENIGIGHDALKANTTGTRNLAIGSAAYTGSDTENDNLAIGYNAMTTNTAGGNSNTAIGNYSMDELTSADNNTAVGYGALTAITTGGDNVAVGTNALGAMIGGGNNIGIGLNTGNSTVGTNSGSGNIYIGSLSHAAAPGTNYTTAIGYNIDGEAGYTTVGQAGSDIRAAHGNVTWATVSDERVKKDITDSTAGLSVINDLRPRTFKYKNKGDIPEAFSDYEEGSTETYKNTYINHGFIAQEVKEVIDNHPELKDGFKMWDIRENTGQQEVGEAAIIPILVKSVQELSAKNDSLETSNQALIARIEALENA
jgi:hypothetical protein